VPVQGSPLDAEGIAADQALSAKLRRALDALVSFIREDAAEA
jgi:hypothetical protein